VPEDIPDGRADHHRGSVLRAQVHAEPWQVAVEDDASDPTVRSQDEAATQTAVRVDPLAGHL
jgi:hypothetical protein